MVDHLIVSLLSNQEVMSVIWECNKSFETNLCLNATNLLDLQILISVNKLLRDHGTVHEEKSYFFLQTT